MSVRETLNRGKARTWVGGAAGIVIVAAVVFIYLYWTSGRVHFHANEAYFSDDDGQSYYKDSIYHFPPYDHDGRTAYEAMVAISTRGDRFVAYLMRYRPSVRKELQEKYDDAVKNNLPVQKVMLNYMNTLPVAMGGEEIKLPGPGHNWVPAAALRKLGVKSPSGDDAEEYVKP
jgi:hypothetical protein